MTKKLDYTISSGNLFADFGFPDAEERFAKVQLALQINDLIEQQNLTQTQAAKLLEVDQPKISALAHGKLAGFSLERLFKFLNILGQNITIKISPKTSTKKRAEVRVTVPKTIKKIIIPKATENTKAIHAKKKK